MKLIALIIALLATLCMGGMLVNAVIAPSPKKGMSVVLFGIMFAVCVRMMFHVIKEWRYGRED